jgi:predicted DsbA family dithiol-disulfide isomerase
VRAERLEREYAVTITWEPWELHPETPPEGRPRPPRARESAVVATARAAGLEMIAPPLIANSRLALEASECVRERTPDAFGDFHHAVFRAYFEHGRNIGDPVVLADLAARRGLGGAELRAALAERRYRELVDEKIQWAAVNGLSSTPTFLFGERFTVVGAQEYEFFELVLKRFGVPKRAE